MSTEYRRRVSVIDPVGPALERVRQILFSPFEIGKWFIIGFCAWLANLGQGGFNFNYNVNFHVNRGELSFEAQQLVDRVKDFIIEYLPFVIAAVMLGIILAIAIVILMLWLSSRGKFMFLHCVAQNRAEIKRPWTKFRRVANSLFVFRLIVGVICFLFFALLVGLIVLIFFLGVRGGALTGIGGLFFAGLLSVFMLPIIIAIMIFLKFTHDFAVPLMSLRNCTCIKAWQELLRLLSNNKGRFVLYILFQIVIGICVGIIAFAAGCIFACLFICFTCGIGCCLMMLPFVSTGVMYLLMVVLLPLLVFRRSYSLCYLRQYGPEFDVFTPPAGPPERG